MSCGFTSFYLDWFSHPEWWFSATENDDEYLRETYGHLLTSPTYDDTEMDDIGRTITRIIVYDQLPRHVYRHRGASHVIDYYLQHALVLAQQVIDSVHYQSLTTKEWVFVMLPFRHTQDLRRVTYVMKEAWKRIERENVDDPALLRKFIKATFDRCPRNQDGMVHHANTPFKETWNVTKHTEVLDHASNLLPNLDVEGTSMYRTTEVWMRQHQPQNIILSLSGGVDSMLASVVLSQLRNKVGFSLNAVHINYMNRDTTMAEEDFVRDWCAFLDIPLYIRRITEIHRPTAMKHDMRDLYEDYTRDVRYNTYKQVMGPKNAWVVLGHNQDDCFENIMTNIAQHKKYDNLSGMAPISIQDSITFFRPFLEVPKSQIYYFAEMHNIPHLPNSTPPWSQRGKIRDIVKPALRDWEPRIVPGMFELSHHLASLHEVLECLVISFDKRTAQTDTDTWELSVHPSELPTTTLFWRSLIQRLTSTVVSMKSLQQFQDRLTKFMESDTATTRFQLEKHLSAFVDKTGHHIRFKFIASHIKPTPS
jgi:tRNA(Ile)-lysidine synthetase-like protein